MTVTTVIVFEVWLIELMQKNPIGILHSARCFLQIQTVCPWIFQTSPISCRISNWKHRDRPCRLRVIVFQAASTHFKPATQFSNFLFACYVTKRVSYPNLSTLHREAVSATWGKNVCWQRVVSWFDSNILSMIITSAIIDMYLLSSQTTTCNFFVTKRMLTLMSVEFYIIQSKNSMPIKVVDDYKHVHPFQHAHIHNDIVKKG